MGFLYSAFTVAAELGTVISSYRIDSLFCRTQLPKNVPLVDFHYNSWFFKLRRHIPIGAMD
jgi:hypothetical protein